MFLGDEQTYLDISSFQVQIYHWAMKKKMKTKFNQNSSASPSVYCNLFFSSDINKTLTFYKMLQEASQNAVYKLKSTYSYIQDNSGKKSRELQKFTNIIIGTNNSRDYRKDIK